MTQKLSKTHSDDIKFTVENVIELILEYPEEDLQGRLSAMKKRGYPVYTSLVLAQMSINLQELLNARGYRILPVSEESK